MRNLEITPTGLAPNKTYRIEVFYESSMVYSKDNIVQGSSVVFPVMNPGTYTVKIYNSEDVLGLCEVTEASEQTLTAYFPIVSYIVSEVDCSNETYTISLSIDNPETSGENIQFGWGNSSICSNATWVTGNIITLPSDGNTKYIFVKDSVCCEEIVQVSKPPCINCNIVIESIVTSCGSVTPPPSPGNECNSYKLTSGFTPSFVFYLDCETFLVESVSLLATESMVICSAATPITSFEGVSIELLGNCPA